MVSFIHINLIRPAVHQYFNHSDRQTIDMFVYAHNSYFSLQKISTFQNNDASSLKLKTFKFSQKRDPARNFDYSAINFWTFL